MVWRISDEHLYRAAFKELREARLLRRENYREKKRKREARKQAVARGVDEEVDEEEDDQDEVFWDAEERQNGGNDSAGGAGAVMAM